MPSQAVPSHLPEYPQYAGLPYLSHQQQEQQQQQQLYTQHLAHGCVHISARHDMLAPDEPRLWKRRRPTILSTGMCQRTS